MKLIVDAGVAIKWFLPEVHSDAAQALPIGADPLFAPDFVLVECGNIVWKKVRLGQLARDDRDATLAALRSGPIELIATPPLIEPALSLAHTLDHPLYDCLYLAAAETMDALAVTADRRFFEQAARTPSASRVRWLADWQSA